MSRGINEGGPAFPCADEVSFEHEGLSARDYFAAKAMAAWISTLNSDDPHPAAGSQTRPLSIAALSYKMADAMLMERDKK